MNCTKDAVHDIEVLITMIDREAVFGHKVLTRHVENP